MGRGMTEIGKLPVRHGGGDRGHDHDHVHDHEGRSDAADPVVIDCDDCAVRGSGCHDCVVSVLLGVPDELLADERAALEVLAEAGMAPRLRLVPVRRGPHHGVA
ncbi:hypothetical protein MCHIJ_34410 [Mycolicibacterium chitae]|uniref:Uncharacterized protein n=2 Tax=Mycolicibacterium chitae TaxID=1792 RepID=A0A448I589_MYCCI|nr:hypothetical protein MCHIJ_34410 [Mycolicibacterium chitae]VEG47656.1 Uncharacterised protein [Mycolicibacterium chitae]